MKVILSKKGVDSSNCDSPIKLFKGEEEMSFMPIPEPENADVKFNKNLNDCFDSNKLIKGETSKFSVSFPANQIGLQIKPVYHVDPQLKNYFKNENFRGCFGQVGGAQYYLNNANVSVGDIFLFYGWYQQERQEQNVIFGYMQVGNILKLKKDNNKVYVTLDNQEPVEQGEFLIEHKELDFLQNHPHWFNAESYENKQDNTIYIANEILKDKNEESTNIRGFGIFPYSDDLILTKKNAKSKTEWQIKGLKDIKEKLTFVNKSSAILKNGAGTVVKGYCQELVFEENDKVLDWAINLIKNNIKKEQNTNL